MKKITASRGADGNWYIRIQNARNGRTVADGGEGYTRLDGALRAIRNNWGDGYTFEVIANMDRSVSFRMVPRVPSSAS